MKKILISIFSGLCILLLSFFLLSRIEDTSFVFGLFVSINFGIFSGIMINIIFEEIKSKKDDKYLNKRYKQRNIILQLITILIISTTANIGINLSGDYSHNEILRLMMLVFSIGYVGYSLGYLTKYIANDKE